MRAVLPLILEFDLFAGSQLVVILPIGGWSEFRQADASRSL